MKRVGGAEPRLAVLAAAERLNETAIATTDRRHFAIVHPAHAAHLELLP